MSEARPIAAPKTASEEREPTLAGAYRTIAVQGTGFKRFAAFLGPGYMVATGYMDPGNWATALAAGSRFGTALLFIVIASSLMAIVLQALSARLAIATGLDLAQVCRQEFGRPAAFCLWLIAETSIIATDLAEVIGTAIGIKLLTGLPLWAGIVITGLDVFLVLGLQSVGFRKLEGLVVSLLIVIALCFALQLALARPDITSIVQGLMPSGDILIDKDMLYLALGILGATIMPHNLYLHSGLMLTRRFGRSDEAKTQAIRFALWDSGLALVFALMINASILILAAATFNVAGHYEMADLQEAYHMIGPLLGSDLAAKLFGLALLACGLNSTITATLAGQIVMEGYIKLRMSPFMRRLLTRGLAIFPAMGVILFAGESEAGRLLVLSQVILSLGLPFAMIPLVHFTASSKLMGVHAAPKLVTGMAVMICVVITGLNVKLLFDLMTG
jgi:manganese transport protein